MLPASSLSAAGPVAAPSGGAATGHFAFISHSVRDREVADTLCRMVEAAGVRCWIAPRDVQPGREWRPSIIDAIEHCQVMVLVFSDASNRSSQVSREVEVAFEEGKTIIPFRIQDTEMNKSLRYCISATHWLDALTPPLSGHAARLVSTLVRLMADAGTGALPPLPPPPPAAAAAACATPPAETIDPPPSAVDPAGPAAGSPLSFPPPSTMPRPRVRACVAQKAARAAAVAGTVLLAVGGVWAATARGVAEMPVAKAVQSIPGPRPPQATPAGVEGAAEALAARAGPSFGGQDATPLRAAGGPEARPPRTREQSGVRVSGPDAGAAGGSAAAAPPPSSPPPVTAGADPEPASPAVAAEAAAEIAAADARAVQEVVRGFAALLQSGDAARIEAAYPGAGGWLSNWRALLSEVRRLRVRVTGIDPPRVEGEAAGVSFTLRLDWSDDAGSRTEVVRLDAGLRRAGGQWVIIRLDTR